MSEITNILHELKDFSLFQLICLGMFLLIAWYIYIDRKESREINKAVNCKKPEEPTLREAVMEIRKTLDVFIATTTQSFEFGDTRIRNLEAKVFKK